MGAVESHSVLKAHSDYQKLQTDCRNCIIYAAIDCNTAGFPKHFFIFIVFFGGGLQFHSKWHQKVLKSLTFDLLKYADILVFSGAATPLYILNSESFWCGP